jgi:5-methylcytosine-specific restriction protein A
MKNARAPVFKRGWGPTNAGRVEQFRKEQAGYRPRPSALARGYDRDWFKLRAEVLREEPNCRHCALAAKTTRATVVDHIEPIRIAPERRLDRDNLQPLCRACDDRKRNRYDGGFGRRSPGATATMR